MLAAVMVSTVTAISLTFSGRFSDVIVVDASVAQAGDALQPGDPVSYRDVIIGEVIEAEGAPAGGAKLKLRLHTAQAREVPANVRTLAVPATLFGSFIVQLIPPARPTGRLQDGAVLAADASPAAKGLQTALTDIYRLMSQIRPAELDAALSTLSQALQGEGANLGLTIEKANAYLRALAPAIPTLTETITNLTTVTEHLARNAPSLLRSVGNLIEVGQVYVDRHAVIEQLLDAGPALDRLAQGISAHGDQLITIAVAQEAVMRAVGADPTALPKTIKGGHDFAELFGTALGGDGVELRAIIIANLAEVGGLLAGQPSNLLKGISNPPVYTSAHCPRYPGMDGPNCSSAASPAAAGFVPLTAGAVYGGTVGPIGSDDERSAVSGLLGAMDISTAAAATAATNLLVAPLLRGNTVVIA